MLPVHVAALNGSYDIFRILLAATFSRAKSETLFHMDTVDGLGRSCLHLAACGGFVEMKFYVFVLRSLECDSYCLICLVVP